MKILRSDRMEEVFISSQATPQGLEVVIKSRKHRVTLLTLTFSRDDLADQISQIDEMVKLTVDGLAIDESTPLAPPDELHQAEDTQHLDQDKARHIDQRSPGLFENPNQSLPD